MSEAPSARGFSIVRPASPIPRQLRVCALLILAAPAARPGLGAQASSEAFSAGRTAVLAGDYDNAIRQLEHAVDLDDSNADYHYWLGRAVYESAPRANKLRVPGMARRVRNEWERAVALDPNQIDARAGLAEWYAMAPRVMGGNKTRARDQASEGAKR